MYWNVLLGLCLMCSQAVSQNTPSPQNATSSALVYGYPLLAFQNLANVFIASQRTNFLVHLREIATPGLSIVVSPNVDTLYSTAIYDLSQTDISITIPAVPQTQFADFAFYDPFGDNFANIQTGPGKAGEYLLKKKSAESSDVGVKYDNHAIISPTTYGIILVRWLANATNLDALHGYQNQTGIQMINQTHATVTPSLLSLNTTTDGNARPAKKVLQLLAIYAPWNPPQNTSATAALNTQLTAAGISNGTYIAPAGIDIETANQSALATASEAAISRDNIVAFDNGWTTPKQGVAGSFNNGTNYAYRMAISLSAYLMLQSPLAIYPTWTNTSSPESTADGSFDLGPDDAYIYTFSRKPPLQRTGFWSLTAYNDQKFLIPNGLNRSEVGDRSNFTYSDGTVVYGTNGTPPDNSFQVLIQAANKPPPSNWTSNWLPGPAGGGNMSAILRFYNARQELLNGTYNYPVVTRRPAITESNGTTTPGRPNSTSSLPAATITPASSSVLAARLEVSSLAFILLLACLGASVF